MNNSINGTGNVAFGAKLEFRNFAGKVDKKRLAKIAEMFEKTTPYKNDVFVMNHHKWDKGVMAHIHESQDHLMFTEDIVIKGDKVKELFKMSNEEIVEKLKKLFKLTKTEQKADKCAMDLLTKHLKLKECGSEEDTIIGITIDAMRNNRQNFLAKDRFLKDALE